MKRPPRQPTEEERLAAIRRKWEAHKSIDQEELGLLLRHIEMLEAHLARHPLRSLYAEAQADLTRVACREQWLGELLRLVEREIRRLAAEPGRNAHDRQALLRRADRIEKRLEQRDPPEGWTATGDPGTRVESRSRGGRQMWRRCRVSRSESAIRSRRLSARFEHVARARRDRRSRGGGRRSPARHPAESTCKGC